MRSQGKIEKYGVVRKMLVSMLAVIVLIVGWIPQPANAFSGTTTIYTEYKASSTINSMAVGNDGSIYYTSNESQKEHCIMKKKAGQGDESIINGNCSVYTDEFSYPQVLMVDGGDVYYSNGGTTKYGTPNGTILYKLSSGTVSEVAGDGTKGYQDGPTSSAKFNSIRGVAKDSKGNLYVTDLGDNRVRKIDTTGNVTTVAGNGTYGTYADGPATSTSIINPQHIAVDGSDNVFFTSSGSRHIYKLTGTTITRIVSLSSIVYGDFVNGLTADASGNLYATYGHFVYKLSASDNYKEQVIAGSLSTPGNGGDYGSPADALTSFPTQLSTRTSDGIQYLYINKGDYYPGVRVIRDGYSVVYEGNGHTTGTVPNPTIYSPTDTVNVVPVGDLAKKYHTFVGWNTASNGSGTDYKPGASLPQQNTRLYAQWDIDKYTLKYSSSSGGSLTGEVSQTVPHGSDGKLVTAVPNIGFAFTGWSDGNTNSARVDAQVTDSISATAEFVEYKYIVQFDSQDGSDVATQYIAENGTATLPITPPTRMGHTFVGWFDNSSATVPFDFSTVITKDTTLVAKWNKNSYNVAYTADASEGTIQGEASQTIEHGADATEVTAVANAGYVFVKWSDNNTSAARQDKNVKGILSVSAVFTPEYTVSFDSQDGSTVEEQKVVLNGKASAPLTAPSRVGYTFDNWYVDLSAVTPFDFTATSITANMTLHAKWEINQYQLTYTAGSNGSLDGIATQTIDYGSDATEVTAKPDTGFGFKTWDDGVLTAARTDLNIDQDRNVTAEFAPLYTITFDSNEGSNVPEQTIIEDGVATLPDAPTLDGYQFVGWYEDSELDTMYNFSTLITGDTTLYAKWIIVPPGATVIETVVAGDANITISWASVDTATAYNIFQSTTAGSYDATPIATVSDSVYSYEATGLTNGTAYYFVVSAVNAGGDSVASYEVSATPRTVPLAPTNVSATVGNGSATISFTAPASDGGSPITQYKVIASPGNITVTGTTTQITVPGLTNGTKYTFTVEAMNVAGYSPISPASNEVTPIAPTTPGNGGGGGTPNTPDTSNTSDGKLTIPAGNGGQTKLGDEIVVTIPTGATDKELQLTVEKVNDTSNLNPNGEVLASPVFDLKGNIEDGFKKPLELALTFDPALVPEDQHAAIHYYDEKNKTWVEITGEVSGSTITAKVSKTGKYAVLVVGKEPAVVEPTDTFSDIANHWAEANIKQAVQEGIVKGYADGTFKPNTTVTRAEFAVMLMNALKSTSNGANLGFSDNANIGAWAQKAVAQAVEANIIKGFTDGSFRPNAELTRAEMAVIIANVLNLTTEANTTTGFADDNVIPAWAKGAVGALKKLELVSGKGANNYDPNATTTRAEAITILLKMLEQENK